MKLEEFGLFALGLFAIQKISQDRNEFVVTILDNEPFQNIVNSTISKYSTQTPSYLPVTSQKLLKRTSNMLQGSGLDRLRSEHAVVVPGVSGNPKPGVLASRHRM